MSTGDGEPRAGRTLDARRVEEPFDRILEALEELSEGETLTLVNSFEPEPLYAVLDARGLERETRRVGPEEWRVEISRT